MARSYLDFEKSLAEIEAKADELRAIPDAGKGVVEDIARLDIRAQNALRDIYTNLTPWQKKLVARHPDRPHAKDYIEGLIDDFIPLAGDRSFSDDEAIIGGFGRFKGQSLCVIAQEKGSTTESRIRHNFGMAKPDGYRKAVRLMEMAEQFQIPVLSLVDTSGAYPGIDAEERGQAEAIARSTAKCLSLTQPNIAVVIGEGGSGGAIALAATSVVLMLEHSIYSVISPEGAASILWRDAGKAEEAATTMRITAQDLLKLGIIDSIIAEPTGGAHRAREEMINRVGENVSSQFNRLFTLSSAELIAERRTKFLNMGKLTI